MFPYFPARVRHFPRWIPTFFERPDISRKTQELQQNQNKNGWTEWSSWCSSWSITCIYHLDYCLSCSCGLKSGHGCIYRHGLAQLKLSCNTKYQFNKCLAKIADATAVHLKCKTSGACWATATATDAAIKVLDTTYSTWNSMRCRRKIEEGKISGPKPEELITIFL